MRLFVPLAGMVSIVLLVAGLAISRPADSGYQLLKTYPFGAAPASTGEYFDYITVDPAARRVYLSRGTAVEVMNADTGAEIGYIGGFKRQHGVALAPEFGRGFISDGTQHVRHRRYSIRGQNNGTRHQNAPSIRGYVRL